MCSHVGTKVIPPFSGPRNQMTLKCTYPLRVALNPLASLTKGRKGGEHEAETSPSCKFRAMMLDGGLV